MISAFSHFEKSLIRYKKYIQNTGVLETLAGVLETLAGV